MHMQRLQSIFLIGPMGAGKSTIGRHLARELSLEFYDSDQVIEARCGARIPWIFDVEGEEGFRKREEMVIAELSQLKNIVLATGGGTVCSPENRAALAARGIVVYLQASLAQQLSRTSRDRNRPLLQTGNVRQTIETLAKEREPLYTELADYTFSTDHRAVRSVALDIVKHLRAKPT
jgi:shikimate kinase